MSLLFFNEKLSPFWVKKEPAPVSELTGGMIYQHIPFVNYSGEGKGGRVFLVEYTVQNECSAHSSYV
jgi:hypothetical protein